MKNQLPNDISRCSNEKCTKRKECARFIQFINDQLNDKVVFINKFKEENCTSFIKYKNE